MRARFGILVAASLVAIAAPAAAQQVSPAAPPPAAAPLGDPAFLQAPAWREGSDYQYSDGYHVRVTSTNGLLTVFERLDAPGQWFSMFGFLRQDAVAADGKTQTIFRTISPYAGAELSTTEPLVFRREYLKNEQLVIHASSWTVEGKDQITTPAGTFDCWVIVWRARSLVSDWTAFERWWYAPSIGSYARMEYKYGDMGPQSRVLMRYSLGDPAAQPDATVAEAAAAAPAVQGWASSGSLAPHPVQVSALPPLESSTRAVEREDDETIRLSANVNAS
jgi:hypothetical protein